MITRLLLLTALFGNSAAALAAVDLGNFRALGHSYYQNSTSYSVEALVSWNPILFQKNDVYISAQLGGLPAKDQASGSIVPIVDAGFNLGFRTQTPFEFEVGPGLQYVTNSKNTNLIGRINLIYYISDYFETNPHWLGIVLGYSITSMSSVSTSQVVAGGQIQLF